MRGVRSPGPEEETCEGATFGSATLELLHEKQNVSYFAREHRKILRQYCKRRLAPLKKTDDIGACPVSQCVGLVGWPFSASGRQLLF